MQRILLTTTALLALTAAAAAQTTTTPGGTAPTPPPPAAAQSPSAPSSTPAAPVKEPAASVSKPDSAAQNAPGLRTVDPATIRVTFYSVQKADVLASELEGLNVVNLQNENVGEIEDFVIDNGKTVKAVILSVGGFLGIGDRRVAVEPGSIVLTLQDDGSYKAVINTTKDDLKKAPEFKLADDEPDAPPAGKPAAAPKN